MHAGQGHYFRFAAFFTVDRGLALAAPLPPPALPLGLAVLLAMFLAPALTADFGLALAVGLAAAFAAGFSVALAAPVTIQGDA